MNGLLNGRLNRDRLIRGLVNSGLHVMKLNGRV